MKSIFDSQQLIALVFGHDKSKMNDGRYRSIKWDILGTCQYVYCLLCVFVIEKSIDSNILCYKTLGGYMSVS